jgi:transposase
MRTRFDGLSEFISRRGRLRLLSVLFDELSSLENVSKMIGVSRIAIYRWLNDVYRHPSNENTHKILKVATALDREKVREILLDELKTFNTLVHKTFGE